MATTPQLTQRAADCGPETGLLEAALVRGLLPNLRNPLSLYLQPRLPLGYPDVVAVEYDPTIIGQVRSSPLLTNSQLRLLQHLHELKSAPLTLLAAATRRTAASLLRDIVQLSKAGFAVLEENVVVPAPLERVFGIRRIIAIEAKMKDWRHALQQAIANTWFASESHVLLPRVPKADVVQEFIRAEIGLMVLAESRCETLCSSAVRQLPVSYGSWLFNEWARRK